jgi:phosphoglycolate phosphatase-like HAD superfamily hydrolase
MRAALLVETRRAAPQRPRLAALDFDGTLSLVRAGWQQTMAHMLLAALDAAGDVAPRRAALVAAMIERTTGRPTLEQMAWLVARLGRLGVASPDAAAWKARYLAALQHTIDARLAELRAGTRDRASLMVPGAAAFVDWLRHAGVALALVSGTDRAAVLAEVQALGLADSFELGIWAPDGDAAGFSKAAILAGLLEQAAVAPAQLLVVGDGAVEIDAARGLGAHSLALALDELRGGVDVRRRRQLRARDAAVIVADLTPRPALAAALGLADAPLPQSRPTSACRSSSVSGSPPSMPN